MPSSEDFAKVRRLLGATAPIIERTPEPTLEKCHGCTYDGDALAGRCAFHAANPDETTHDGIAGELLEPPAPALELAIERSGPPGVIGEPPCAACAENRFCIEHTGQSRRPFVAPTPLDDLAVVVVEGDEAPPTPRDPGTSTRKKQRNR
jgi:hypothetical protein